MSFTNDSPAGAYTALENLELALQQELVSGKNKKDADFKEAYPLIEQHLANKVSQKAVLEKFNAAYGYALHPPRFRKMLLGERKRRAEAGDVVVCDACGHPLDSGTKTIDVTDNKEGV